MPELLQPFQGVACRACGAVRAPQRAGATDEMCANCWVVFDNWRGSKSEHPTEEDINRWLARKTT